MKVFPPDVQELLSMHFVTPEFLQSVLSRTVPRLTEKNLEILTRLAQKMLKEQRHPQ